MFVKESAEKSLEIPTSMVSLNLQEYEIRVQDEPSDARSVNKDYNMELKMHFTK